MMGDDTDAADDDGDVGTGLLDDTGKTTIEMAEDILKKGEEAQAARTSRRLRAASTARMGDRAPGRMGMAGRSITVPGPDARGLAKLHSRFSRNSFLLHCQCFFFVVLAACFVLLTVSVWDMRQSWARAAAAVADHTCRAVYATGNTTVYAALNCTPAYT